MEYCKECGNRLVGRVDRKFCSDGCRNVWHNRISREENCEIRKINRILAKNQKILKWFLDEKTEECTREKLSEKGFNFSFFTSSVKKPGCERCFFCYDLGYYCLKKGVICITREN